MSGMGDGYVGTAQDAVRIRRLEKQREAERRKIQELKSKSATSNGQPGLLQFGSSTSEVTHCFAFIFIFLLSIFSIAISN
jgi:protein FAM50